MRDDSPSMVGVGAGTAVGVVAAPMAMAAVEPRSAARTALGYSQGILDQAWPIIARALTKSERRGDPVVSFDIQGHALLVVAGTYCSIDLLPLDRIPQLNKLLGVSDRGDGEEAVSSGAGGHIGPTTVTADSIRHYVTDYLTAVFDTPDFLEPYLTSSSRHSIINIQQEVDMHVRLQLRALLMCMNGSMPNDEELEPYVQQCMAGLLATLRAKTTAVLIEGMLPRYKMLNIALVNKAIDGLRAEIFERAERGVFEVLRNRFPAKPFPNASTLKKALKRSPAFLGDFLYTDNENGTAVLIGGSQHTAHDKQRGPTHQALRIIERFQMSAPFLLPKDKKARGVTHSTFNPFELQLASDDGRREARVPSLAAVDVGLSEKEAIDDVVAKLQYAHERIGGSDDDALVYNLLTSIVMPAYNMLSTVGLYSRVTQIDQHQTLSADIIVQAIHRYNMLSATKKCYLQNIPVNQHGTGLDLNSRHVLVRELSLMASLSLIDTLYSIRASLPREEKLFIEDLHSKAMVAYRQFLSTGATGSAEAYFCKSAAGLRFKGELAKAQKYGLKHDRHSSYAYATRQFAGRALYGLFVSGLYLDQQFGALMQTLSVLLQKKSLYGCKSANERWQMVAGRLNALLSMKAKRSEMLLAANEHTPEMILRIFRALCLRNDIRVNLGRIKGANCERRLYELMSDVVKLDADDPVRKAFLLVMEQNPETFALYSMVNFANQSAYCYSARVLRSHAEFMQLGLCCAYDKMALYGAASVVSLEDQGMSSKLQIKSSDRTTGRVTAYHTNFSERGVGNLMQSAVSDYQAHKSASRMAEMAKEYPIVSPASDMRLTGLRRAVVDESKLLLEEKARAQSSSGPAIMRGSING